MQLNQLPKGKTALIFSLNCPTLQDEEKMREIGFAEGDEVEMLHHGPLAQRPFCVRLNQTQIALRREEAACINVVISDA